MATIENTKLSPLLDSYLEYNRSIVSQRKEDPTTKGLIRGAETGAIGAILAAILARIINDNPAIVAGSAGVGGLLAGIPGFISGRDEAISNYSKLLALRREGVNTPLEMNMWDTKKKLPNKLNATFKDTVDDE